jgi:membrane fusion protein, multidrug efflux system
LIPQQGVSRDPKGNPTTLVVDENNKVGLRTLELDRAIGDRWLVTKGLSPGDRVIVEGIERVRPDTLVHAVPFAGPVGNAPKTGDSQPSAQAK